MRNPKADHITDIRLHKTMSYYVLHTGGFVRLVTERGRVYWAAQNETSHYPSCLGHSRCCLH
jgi:hypothetical protein